MPLAQKPYRPKPEVELLRRARISVEAVQRSLKTALSSSSSKSTADSLGTLMKDAALEVPGSHLVSFRNIPAVLRSVQRDWVTLPKEHRSRSCFVEVTGRLETHLHPVYLSSLANGLRGAAGCLLHRYSDCLGCIPLAFTEIKPASQYAAVVAESPYVHFLIEFKAVGFDPRQGDWIVGRPSMQQLQAGFNITVLGLVNCFIKKDQLPEDLKWEGNTWVDANKVNTGGVDEDQPAEEESANADPANSRVGNPAKVPGRIWLKLREPMKADKNTRLGNSIAPDLRCELGWPSTAVTKTLAKEYKKRQNGADGAEVATKADSKKRLSTGSAEEAPSVKKKKHRQEQEEAQAQEPEDFLASTLDGKKLASKSKKAGGREKAEADAQAARGSGRKSRGAQETAEQEEATPKKKKEKKNNVDIEIEVDDGANAEVGSKRKKKDKAESPAVAEVKKEKKKKKEA
eukprot:TRINITY_DN35355_c0_g1_i1.p1 TRINITY_DN35355_c0_g1~~TRINITY_DN35355_c0_g1_i1.p1  ORF type:complete len:458 (-),score=128.75 TRINITY_DN35355_c0_g1_i1:145-1518(-)